MDYGINVHVHPSCFIDRDCYILDTPESDISIGENTIVRRSSLIRHHAPCGLERERQGRYGVSLAGDVRIEKECFLELV